MSGGGGSIAAVLFDLDDTLFLQEQWLAGAWGYVADVGESAGLAAEPLLQALHAIAAEGSDKGGIIDRALEATGGPVYLVPTLVAAFRGWRADRLEPIPGVVDMLAALRGRLPIGLVTDGEPGIQRNKITALGLQAAFDVVVISDELGRGLRKPSPVPFLRAADALGVAPAAVVMVGDRPNKDVDGAHAAGMRAARVRTGEYRHLADRPGQMVSATDVVAAVHLLEPDLGGTLHPRRRL